jgi:pimeloyl-ACP methyl ester carboxylesterase
LHVSAGLLACGRSIRDLLAERGGVRSKLVVTTTSVEGAMARVVLVHGAFAGAWCWEPVLPGLRAAGHTVDTLDLPGSGEDRTPVAEITLDAYAERVCEVLAAGPPAVLVGHSMGGMVITQAAARGPRQIRSLIYVSAFLPADGQSLLDLTMYPEAADDQVQANLVLDEDQPIATMPTAAARGALFGCCDDEQAAWGIAQLGGQPVVPFGQPVSLGDRLGEAFGDPPADSPGDPPADSRGDPPADSPGDAFVALRRAYVTCLRDRAIPPPMQRRMFEEGGCDPVIEIDTDHSPWVSRTDELVAALDQLAGGG